MYQYADRRDYQPRQRPNEAGPQVGFRPNRPNNRQRNSGPPAPQHLSKTESVEKNDLLYKEAVFCRSIPGPTPQRRFSYLLPRM